jgi:hypothetical protein
MMAAMEEHTSLLKTATRHSQQLLTSLTHSPGTAATPEAAMVCGFYMQLSHCLVAALNHSVLQARTPASAGAVGAVAAPHDRVQQAQQVMHLTLSCYILH